MGVAVAAYHGLTSGQKRGLWRLLAILPALFIAIVVAIPFTIMLVRFLNIASLGSLGGNSVMAELTRRAFANSLIQGAISAATSFAVGLPLGLFLGRYEFRFRRFLRSFAILPFFLPSIVVVSAFLVSFGKSAPLVQVTGSTVLLSRGLGGIIAVNTFFNAPIVAMMVMLAVEQADRSLEEASSTLGADRMRRFYTIWGRDGLTAGAGGAFLAFLYSFAGFTAPLVIGGPGYFTMEAWIYYLVRTLNSIPVAALLSFIEMAALLVPAVLYFVLVVGARKVYGRAGRYERSGEKSDSFFVAGLIYAVLWIVVEGYVLGSVFYSSLNVAGSGLSLSNFTQLFGPKTESALGISTYSTLANSLFYGLVVSLTVTAIGLAWIYARRRVSSKGFTVTDTVQFLPLVVSAAILSFSLAVTFEYGSAFSADWVLIVIAQSVIAIPIVLRVIESGFASVPASYSEAAMTLGGNSFFEIDLPLTGSTLASSLMFGFSMSLGEFTATNFLATTPYTPIGVQIYLLQNVRLFGAADAAAALLLLMSLLSFYFIQRLGEVLVAVR